jgi:predicted dehydrogenase
VVRVGLVGYGYWGPNLARNISDTDGLRLAAIADAREDRRAAAAKRYPGVATFDDGAALAARGDVDAVVIATPLHTHYALALAALGAGRHVLVEKPLAGSCREADALGDLAARQGVRLMVDHTFVYSGAVRRIRELIDEGALGDLLYLDSVRVNLGLFQRDANVMWDLAAHDLAVMDYLVDERPVAVSAIGSAVAGYDHENIAYVAVHFESGFLAHFHVNWLAPAKVRHMMICGRRQMLVYDDMDPREKVRVYDQGVDFGVEDVEARRQILVSYRTGDMFAPKLDRREALSVVIAEFAAAIAGGREPLTGIREGRRVVAVLEAAAQSMREEGRRVRL